MLRTLKATPIPVILTLVAFLMPTELSLYVGSLRLPPHRCALIIFTLFALVRLMIRRDPGLKLFDVVFALYAAWTVSIFMVHEGVNDGIEFGGSLALESFGAYFVARVYIRDERTFRATLLTLLGCVAVAALIALPETVFGGHYVHDFLHKATGYYHPIAYEKRLGLTRAYGTFDHPILYGTFCASAFAVLWFSGGTLFRKGRRVGFVAFATVLGVSSAPILCLMTQGIMMAWERMTRGIAGRITMAVFVLTIFYAIVEVLTDRSALEVIVTRVTLDPWTAYYRIQIWKHGLETVVAHPWTGIGLADWERAWWMTSPSVDAFWLLIMMRAGIPALLLMLLAIALQLRAMSVATTAGRAGKPILSLATGWTISLLALCLLGLTVHYWNALHAYLFFFIGMGAWMTSAKAVAPARVRTRAPVARLRHDLRTTARPYAPTPSAS